MNTHYRTVLLLALAAVVAYGCANSKNPLDPATHRVSRTQSALVHADESIVLWNRLGSEEEITHSPMGVSGQIVGELQYLPGQFGSGFAPQPRSGDHNIPDNFVRFDGLSLGPQGCIEFWYQPTWSDWRVGHVVDLLYCLGQGASGGIQIGYNDWQQLLGFWVYDGNGSGVQRSVVPGNVPQWSTAHPFHVAITWDGTAVPVPDRVKVFFDGTEVPTMIFAYGDPRFEWPGGLTLWLATRPMPGDWNRHNWEGGEGVIDNLKIWNYPKSDFSDRFMEAPAKTVAVDVLPGTCPNPFNLRANGVVHVGILGTSDFAVADIDVESLRLNGIAPLRSSFEDVAGPALSQAECDCTAAGPDARVDLNLAFARPDLAESLGDVADGQTVPLFLSGKLKNGWSIEGRDCVKVKIPGGGRKLPT